MNKKKKRGGVFLKTCIVLAGIWILAAGAITVYFQAKGNPLDPTVVAILFAPGVGEFGFGALIQRAKEKNEADDAREKAEALQAELDSLQADFSATQKKLSTAQADSRKMKTERDAAKTENEKLKQQALPIEEIVRQLQAAQAKPADS